MNIEEMQKEENFEHEVLDRLKCLTQIDFDYNAVDGSYVDAVLKARDVILTAYEKEKEKNKELYNLSDMILRYYDNGKGMQVETKGFISKDKIREIIYPTPENYIPVEVQQSDMYKKLVKEVEE